MCHNRLDDGMPPACVAACPEGAIAIEIVRIAEWRRDYLSADAPGLPSADDSISTTRVTLPDNLVPDTGRVDLQRVEPEHPHWPLVFMLVLTQLSVGAFAVLWLLDLLGRGTALTIAALASLGLAGISLGASTLHLGRPIYAFRALKGLRQSWLSREVLTLSLFAGTASAFAGVWLFDLPGRGIVGLLTFAAGLAGVTCSARIYLVQARPAWFSGHTVAEFYSTALLLGPLFVQMLDGGVPSWVRIAAIAGASSQLIAQILKFLWLSRSEVFELRASSLLLSGRLQNLFVTRLAVLAIAGIVLPLVATRAWIIAVAFTAALAGEWLGRYLFFVSVVPKNMAAAFAAGERRAA
jgi:DMSO reductase anchor subunit